MPLHETQRTLARLIRAPEGVAVALEEEIAAEARREPDRIAAETSSIPLGSLVRHDTRADATTRLEIYANAYYYRLLGVLEQDYAAVARHLGPDLFRDVVTSYLLAHPPSHASLRYAGIALADFLSKSEAAAGVRQRAPWVADLAALEWARVDVFDAIDGEVLARDALATRSVEEFATLELTLGSWTVIRSYDYPVDTLLDPEPLQNAAKFGEEESGMGSHDSAGSLRTRSLPDPTTLIVWRRSEKVVHRRIDRLEESALALVSMGTDFGSLCEFASRESDDAAAPGVAAGWLEQWLSDGLLLSD